MNFKERKQLEENLLKNIYKNLKSDLEKIGKTSFNLETLFNQSCSLVFIHNWKLTTTPVGQFEGAKFIH